jgi:hypothetical protein
MAAAGPAILLVAFSVGLGVWSLIYVTFASHYFLCTIIDSTSGNDEVHYPGESIIDWWWKPILCGWVLSFCVLSGAVLMSPLAFFPLAFGIALAAWVWFLFPLAILSVLFTSNWCFFLHPTLVWRILKHSGPLAYVHLITSISAAICVGLLMASLTHNFLWALPAALMMPTALLFYARHWGRLAWVSVHFVPRKKTSGAEYVDTTEDPDDIPEMAVQEVEEGMREGLPPTYAPPNAIQSATLPLAEEEDEWATNKKPYAVIGDEPAEPFERPEPVAVPAPSTAAMVEEEDEWATDKKPYGTIETATPPPPQSEANTPVTNSKYYDERARREKAKKARAKSQTDQLFLPTPSKKTPSFAKVMFFGVWGFMVYSTTVRVWVNLVVLTIVELFLVTMVVRVLSMLG